MPELAIHLKFFKFIELKFQFLKFQLIKFQFKFFELTKPVRAAICVLLLYFLLFAFVTIIFLLLLLLFLFLFLLTVPVTAQHQNSVKTRYTLKFKMRNKPGIYRLGPDHMRKKFLLASKGSCYS